MAYREPGVQSVFIASPGGESLIGTIRTPAIVGKGLATYTVTEEVTRSATAHGSDALAHTATQIVRVGNYAETKDYTLTTDYVLTSGAIAWTPTASPAKEPTANQKYYVTYTYAKVAGDYIPKLFDNMSDVIAEYGPITFSGTTPVLDTTAYLSMGAQLAFKNGARQVILCQVNDPATATSFDDAFTLLEEEVGGQNPEIICAILDTLSATSSPASAYDSGVTYLLAHILNMSSKEFAKERTAHIGMFATATPAEIIVKAGAVKNERMLIIAPTAVCTLSYNGVSADCTVPTNFVACAVAGLDVSQDVAEPLTRKLLNGFKSLGVTYTKVQMDSLATAGVTVIKSFAGVLRIRDGVTTDTTTVNTIEPTVPQIKDYCVRNIRNILDSYVGKKMSGVEKKMQESGNNVLSQIQGETIIEKFSPLVVRRDQTTPTKVKASFAILPEYGLKWVDLDFTIDLGLMG